MTKASFDNIYVAPDPRAYYQTLGDLDYQVPEHGSAVFRTLAEAIAEARDGDEAVRMVDLCCSYGINGALMKHRIDYSDVVDHYAAADPAFDRAGMLAFDREWFGDYATYDDIEVVGIDTSEPAIRYSTDAGFLDAGIAADLESEALSESARAELRSVDLVTVTGGIGYITETTFDKVLDAADGEPWLAALCLRWVDYEPIAAAAAEHGLVTERLPGVTYPQRRFADDDEREFVLGELGRRGIDPTDRELTGYHHTDVFVARPAHEVAQRSLVEIFSSAAVGNRS